MYRCCEMLLMLATWLEGNNGEVSWTAFSQALVDAGLPELADSLKDVLKLKLLMWLCFCTCALDFRLSLLNIIALCSTNTIWDFWHESYSSVYVVVVCVWLLHVYSIIQSFVNLQYYFNIFRTRMFFWCVCNIPNYIEVYNSNNNYHEKDHNHQRFAAMVCWD